MFVFKRLNDFKRFHLSRELKDRFGGSVRFGSATENTNVCLFVETDRQTDRESERDVGLAWVWWFLLRIAQKERRNKKTLRERQRDTVA